MSDHMSTRVERQIAAAEERDKTRMGQAVQSVVDFARDPVGVMRDSYQAVQLAREAAWAAAPTTDARTERREEAVVMQQAARV